MSYKSIALGINIDHVATLRQARRGRYPDPVHAALTAEMAGADSITLHLREDRRHIQIQDVRTARDLLKTHMNLEMAVTDEMIEIARVVRPSDCCFVPERRQEITTEGGLDVRSQVQRIKEATAVLMGQGIRVALFIDPGSAADRSRRAGRRPGRRVAHRRLCRLHRLAPGHGAGAARTPAPGSPPISDSRCTRDTDCTITTCSRWRPSVRSSSSTSVTPSSPARCLTG